jgi:hypothetical protein
MRGNLDFRVANFYAKSKMLEQCSIVLLHAIYATQLLCDNPQRQLSFFLSGAGGEFGACNSFTF